jgi:hypothetical protein
MTGKGKTSSDAARGGGRMVDLTHARHDRAHVLAPGLFRSLGPGERKRKKLDVIYDYGNEARIEFQAFEPLGVLEMRVLQGIVAMAGPDGLVLKDQDEASPEGVRLMLDLFEPDPAVQAAKLKPASLVVRDSLRRLAREIGMDEGGKSLKAIRKSVERLFGVTIFVQTGKRRLGMRLLAAYASDEGTGDLYVALNPRIASAVMGDTPHARIDLAEVRQLESDPARFIHQRLCGWIDPGNSREVGIDTLSGYVWPDEAKSDSATRMRKMRVRRAVQELVDLGWQAEELRRDLWRITRRH